MKTFAKPPEFIHDSSTRPGRIHFGPLNCWTNDPAGLVYCDGLYHMFFQVNPGGTSWGNIHWGHTVSRDLVNWQMRPLAITPHPELGLAFTGSVVVDSENSSGLFPERRDGFVAFLTTASPVPGQDRYTQTQSIAYSRDRGETWQWHSDNPVIPDQSARDFRDPKVFRDEERSRWCAVISRGQSVSFYASVNLLEWWHLSTSDLPAVPDVCECPDLIRMDYRGGYVWVLFYSVSHDSRGLGSGVRYQLGSFDGVRFVPDVPRKQGERVFDVGFDHYALQSWYGLPDSDGPVTISWANNSAYAHDLPAVYRGVNGMMTVPRLLELAETETGLTLVQRPAIVLDEAADTRMPALDCGSGCLQFLPTDSGPFYVMLRGGSEQVSYLQIEISCYNGFYLDIHLDFNAGEISARRTAPKLDTPEMDSRHLMPSPARPVECLVLMDRGIVELFLNGGTAAATYQIFDEGTPVELKVKSPGAPGTIEVTACRVEQPKRSIKKEV